MHPKPSTTNKMTNDDSSATTTSLDFIATQSKSMLTSLLPTTTTTTTTIVHEEGRNNNISPANSTEEQREGISSSSSTPQPPQPSYHTIRYAHLPNNTTTNNYTTLTTKSGRTKGRRAYRLNLERPFNIHCEQSPLEYGDIFAPWSKEVRPKTVGPTEYCPPRHLGGEGGVWRQLLKFNTSAGGTNNKGAAAAVGKVNTGWRQLTEKELSSVQRLGELNDQGEYSFVTYDLSHVKKKKSSSSSAATTNNNNDDDEEGDSGRVITPSTSLDSTSTTDSNPPKSATTKAAETARLFRRSELSLRDAAEKQAAIEKAERDERKALRKQKERDEMDALKSIKGAKGMSKRMSKRASLNGQKLMRKLSSMGGGSTASGMSSSGTSSTSRTLSAGSNYRGAGAGGGGIYEGGAMSRRKLVSTQAGMIEKAKDLIDEESEDEYDGEKYDDTKKITNMSLYIVGEYDILNDLCIDGSKRLKNSKDLSDLEVLLQNEPCPPPNRWVRKTGWGKCNPSSMYAECPPEGFDWDVYLNKDGPVKVNPVPRPVMSKRGSSSLEK